MQNQILAFFIITCISLGVLCGVQWKQLREKQQEISALRQKVAEQTVSLDGQAASVATLEREQGRLSRELKRLDQQVLALQEATNALTDQLSLHMAPSTDSLEVLEDLLEHWLEQYQASLRNTPFPLQQEQRSMLSALMKQCSPELASTNDATQLTAPITGDTLENRFAVQLLRQEQFNRRVLEQAADFLHTNQLAELARSQTNQVQLQRLAFKLAMQGIHTESAMETKGPP